MTVFSKWDEFHNATLNLVHSSPRNCRIVTKWQRNGSMIIRTTDDIHCFQFKSPSSSDPDYNEKIPVIIKGWEELQLAWIQKNASKSL